MLQILRESKPDPKDPSSVVKEYIEAWWTQAADWERKRHRLFDLDAAFDFYLAKVSWAPAPVVVSIKCHG